MSRPTPSAGTRPVSCNARADADPRQDQCHPSTVSPGLVPRFPSPRPKPAGEPARWHVTCGAPVVLLPLAACVHRGGLVHVHLLRDVAGDLLVQAFIFVREDAALQGEHDSLLRAPRAEPGRTRPGCGLPHGAWPMSPSEPAPCPCVTHHPAGPAPGAHLAPRPRPQQLVPTGGGDRHPPRGSLRPWELPPHPCLGELSPSLCRDPSAGRTEPHGGSSAPVLTHVCKRQRPPRPSPGHPPGVRGGVTGPPWRSEAVSAHSGAHWHGLPVKGQGHHAPRTRSSVACRCWDFGGAPGAVRPRALRLGAPGHCFVTTCSREVGVL